MSADETQVNPVEVVENAIQVTANGMVLDRVKSLAIGGVPVAEHGELVEHEMLEDPA